MTTYQRLYNYCLDGISETEGAWNDLYWSIMGRMAYSLDAPLS